MTSDKSDTYMNNILDPPESQVRRNNEKSEIANFYAGKNILVTGGTGFLGKLLIEKLLRSCPDIKTIYMMIRPKKGKTSEDRFQENFSEVIYDRLKQEQPNFLNKIVMVEGDAVELDFSLNEESKNMLINTNIIFHIAATVRFDEKIRLAVNINVKITKSLLLWAKQLPNFNAFVYVSTAFSNCIHDTIKEIHYKPPIEVDKILTLIDCLDDDKLEAINPILRDKCPNNYVLTKATAENAVLKYGDGIPVCIVRPSIVIATSNEPIKGWINNLYGATGVVIGSAVGLLHSLHCVPENRAEIIPADYVISNMIAAAWDIGTRKSLIKSEQKSDLSPEEKIPIYNSVSSCQNPISWARFMKLNETFGLEVPSMKVIWYYSFVLNRNWFVHQLYVFFFHLIPAVIIDTIARITGRNPILLDAYRKVHKFSEVIEYFSVKQWNFRNENVIKLWEKLNAVDQKIFNFNIKNLDWEEYFYHQIRGLRLYMLKDPLDTVDESRVRYRRLRWVHKTLLTFISLLLLWSAISFVSLLWSYYPSSH